MNNRFVNTPNALTRRTLIQACLLSGAMLPMTGLLAGRSAAADLPDLDTADPTAKALGYVTRSKTPGQECSGCTQFVGKPGDATGGCNIFPGKRVAGAGWCLSYVKRAGV